MTIYFLILGIICLLMGFEYNIMSNNIKINKDNIILVQGIKKKYSSLFANCILIIILCTYLFIIFLI